MMEKHFINLENIFFLNMDLGMYSYTKVYLHIHIYYTLKHIRSSNIYDEVGPDCSLLFVSKCFCKKQ